MRRRPLLTAVGLSATAATAGCLNRGNQQVQLARFSAENFDSEIHQFDLRVDRDGETVHWSTHEIRGKGENRIYGAVADCDWETAPGTYEVFARVDAGEWTSKLLTDVKEGWLDSVKCATAHVECHDNGHLWLRLQDNCERFVPSRSTNVCSIEHETDE